MRIGMRMYSFKDSASFIFSTSLVQELSRILGTAAGIKNPLTPPYKTLAVAALLSLVWEQRHIQKQRTCKACKHFHLQHVLPMYRSRISAGHAPDFLIAQTCHINYCQRGLDGDRVASIIFGTLKNKNPRTLSFSKPTTIQHSTLSVWVCILLLLKQWRLKWWVTSQHRSQAITLLNQSARALMFPYGLNECMKCNYSRASFSLSFSVSRSHACLDRHRERRAGPGVFASYLTQHPHVSGTCR